MADYVELDLITDTETLVNTGLQYMEQAIDGWVPRPANIETVLLEGNAQICSEVLDQASQVPPAVYATIGDTIYGIARQLATPAVASAIFTFAPDTPAVMVDAQTQLIIPNPSGEGQTFLTDADIIAPAGGGDVPVGVTAAEPGAAANGSFGTAELVTDVDGVDTVTVTTAQGGTDDEDIDDYLDRLTNALTLLAPRPILPADHATLALQVPGVGRALALDLYMPGTSENPVGDTDAPEYTGVTQTNVPRCTTLAIATTDGAAPDTALKQRVFDRLDAQREVNFLNFVIAPTYTVIDVQATVMAYPGFAAQDVKMAAETSVRDWLNPTLWGAPPGLGGSGDWAQNTKARIYEAVDYLNRAIGVHYVVTVQLRGYPVGGSAGAWGSVDIDLPGAAPLPQAGQITVTAQLP